MTKIGKIIVIANTVMSFLFLGLTTLVFTTKVDLRAEEARQNAILKPIRDYEQAVTKQNKEVGDAGDITGDKIKDLKTKRDKATTDAESIYKGYERELKQVRTEIGDQQAKTTDTQKALTQNREEVRKQEGIQVDVQGKADAEAKKKFDLENKLYQKTNLLNVLQDRSGELSRRAKELQNPPPRSSTGNRD